jgi:phosphotransferase system enzyme I (PtsI)
LTQNREERIFHGIAASPGVARGSASVLVRREFDIPKRTVSPEEREEEITRFERGLLETRRQISAIRAEVAEKLSEDEAAIFDAHQMVLEDRALIEETIREVVESGFNIEYSFQTVANRYIDAFSKIEDEYIKERAADIRDVSRRLLSNLLGRKELALSTWETRNIIVADDLSPSDTAHLDAEKVLAIATDGGGRTSHSVIMARSLNVPCVVGLKDLSSQISVEDEVLVDGFDGVVIVNPSEASLYRYGQLKERRASIERKFADVLQRPAETTDGEVIELRLNIDGSETSELLTQSGAAGVGLYRTENLFLASREFPDEESQYKNYRRIVESVAPHGVTIRTLDLGGDKNPHNSLYGYEEANPFMGFRAIRFCLDNPGLFKEQLRAILRASAHGKVRVMYPMIASCEEVIAANAMLEEAKAELRERGLAFDEAIECGCMIEVPSAAVITDLLADHCDFFSIGTNDLVQYMLAVDRVNDRIAHLYNPNNPAVLRALNFIFQGGRRKKRPVSVCGELAGDPIYAVLLFGMGATELSLSWSSLPEVKYLIRQISYQDARDLAMNVLRLHTSAEIEDTLRSFYRAHINID